jgi:hypothetical protein
VTEIGALDRVRDLLAAEADGPIVRGSAGRPVAIGWATVELDRAAAELGVELGIDSNAFIDADATIALGGACRVARGVLPGAASLVLLEPITEGFLAATLARHAEGPAAIWVAVTDLRSAVAALAVAGAGTTVERGGPFGRERLVLDGTVYGPHRLLVDLAGTIRP